MGFSAKAKHFFEEKNLDNRQISKIMDGYSESLISRYLNSDNISKTFIQKIKKYFPDADINFLISDDLTMDSVAEAAEEYKTRNLVLIEELEERLRELKLNLSRN
jgi:hypothetical protein